jgi:hypothetical protein
VAEAFNSVGTTAADLASEQARSRRNVARMFVSLGRRNQSLLSRQLEYIDELEREESDADVLEHLFQLDHLATRMRRNAESLLVLAGEESPRRWSEPVPLGDVVRGAVGEIEDYQRVRIEGLDEVRLVGRAVSDVAHLLAELIENATNYSPPDAAVSVTGRHVDAGYSLAVTDHGVGMTAEQFEDANRRIDTSPRMDRVPASYLGLFVVGRLAARHAIRVRLVASDGEGVTARVLLPAALVAAPSSDAPQVQEAEAGAASASAGAERTDDVRVEDDVWPGVEPAAVGAEVAVARSGAPHDLPAAPEWPRVPAARARLAGSGSAVDPPDESVAPREIGLSDEVVERLETTDELAPVGGDPEGDRSTGAVAAPPPDAATDPNDAPTARSDDGRDGAGGAADEQADDDVESGAGEAGAHEHAQDAIAQPDAPEDVEPVGAGDDPTDDAAEAGSEPDPGPAPQPRAGDAALPPLAVRRRASQRPADRNGHDQRNGHGDGRPVFLRHEGPGPTPGDERVHAPATRADGPGRVPAASTRGPSDAGGTADRSAHDPALPVTDEDGVVLTDAERRARQARRRLATFQRAVRHGRAQTARQHDPGASDG